MASCAKCGFELDSSLLEAKTVCPECGATVGASHRLRKILQRRRQQPALEFPRANVFNRAVAGLFDIGVLMIAIMPLYQFVDSQLSLWWSWLAYLIPVGFLIGKDSFNGRSPGKLLTGLVTVELTSGRPCGFAESIMRNWFLAVFIAPPDLLRFTLGRVFFALFVVVIGFQILIHLKKRMGDGLARTQVINIVNLRPEAA